MNNINPITKEELIERFKQHPIKVNHVGSTYAQIWSGDCYVKFFPSHRNVVLFNVDHEKLWSWHSDNDYTWIEDQIFAIQRDRRFKQPLDKVEAWRNTGKTTELLKRANDYLHSLRSHLREVYSINIEEAPLIKEIKEHLK